MNLNTLLKRLGAPILAMGFMCGTPHAMQAGNADNRYIGFISATQEGTGDGDVVLSSDQERAAYNFFAHKYCTESNVGVSLSSHNLSSLDASTFKCVWVHIDRKDITSGWRNLPAEFTTPEFLRALHDYMLEGGNIYLSGQAVQLVVPIWRVNQKFTVNQWDNTDATVTTEDTWSIRTDHAEGEGRHPIFDGLTPNGADNIYGILSGNEILRENHNSIYNLNNLTYKYGSSEEEEGWGTDMSNIEKFEKDNQATILATFDWDRNYEYAGIVEFHPIYSWDPEHQKYDRQSGTIICNGMGAFQWNCNEPNECHYNIEKLTDNVLGYLSGTPTVKEGHPYCLPSSDDSVEILESTGMIAMYIDFPGTEEGLASLKKHPQEYAAYNYFVDNFVNNAKFKDNKRRPEVIWGNQTDRIAFAGQEETDDSRSGFECVWVNIARLGLHGELREDGTIDMDRLKVDDATGLPLINPTAADLRKIYATADGQYDRLIDRLRNFRAEGGNIYTSKWANLLLPEIADIMSPTQVTCSPKTITDESESWGINVAPHNTLSGLRYDQQNHPINQGLPLYTKNHGTGYSLLTGKGKRRDANCVWWLDQIHCGDDAVWNLDPIPSLLKFNETYNATVLGTWGHDEEPIAFRTASVVEFHPDRQAVGKEKDGPQRVTPKPTVLMRRGTIIANGTGAYEWAAIDPDEDVNYSEDDSNVRKLTGNILSYLTPVMTEPTYTGIEDAVEWQETDTAPVYYNLQGIRVENPKAGIYIEKRGNRTIKTVIP